MAEAALSWERELLITDILKELPVEFYCNVLKKTAISSRKILEHKEKGDL